MRSKAGLLLGLLVLFSTSVVAATGFTVSTTAIDTAVRPGSGDAAQFNITVTNTGDTEETFRVNYNTGTATSPEWYSLTPIGGYVTVPAGASRNVTIDVMPSSDAVSGNQGPEVYVYPLGEPSNRFSTFVTFSIIRDQSIVMTEFTAPAASYRPGENMTVELAAKNVVQEDQAANSYRMLVSFAGEEYTASGPALDPGETERLRTTIPITEIRAGEYTVETYLMRSDGQVFAQRSARVTIEGAPEIVTDRGSSGWLLSGSRTVEKRNIGNERSGPTTITMRVPWYTEPFVGVAPEPTAARSYSGGTEYVWRTDGLAIDGSITARTTHSYYILVLLAIVLAAGGYVLYRRFRSVRIVKVVRRTSDGGVAVHLRLKNRTGRTISDVELEDFVPGIAELEEEFDARRPDQVRHTDDGTKLLWRMGTMDADEERIMTYRLDPRVEVEGRVSLPSATVTFEERGEQQEQSSHPVSVDFS